VWASAYAATVVFAGAFVWVVGHRGVFLLDQSMMFDGGWRILQGQVPYRDFFSTFPLVPLVIQSLFFWAVGVDFSAMVLAAAFLNAAATACVIAIVRRLLPKQPATALIAGILTAFWFQAPFGTLWFEQTAFFFNVVALLLLVVALTAESNATSWLRVGAGVSIIAAMLSKQNAGIEFIPLAVGAAALPCLLAGQMRNATAAALQVLGGVAIALAVFVGWLWTFSSPANFWHSYFVLARQIASDRINVATTIWGIVLLQATWYTSAVAVVVLAAGLWKYWRSGYRMPHAAIITWIVLGSVFYQNLFKLHTDNELENALPYLGLVYALAIGFTLEIFWHTGPVALNVATTRIRMLLYVLVAAIILWRPFYHGLLASSHRTVQQFSLATTFDDRVAVPGLSRVKWGEPTVINYPTDTTLSRTDFERLNSWLSAADSNFFVFPDSTMLYGLHHRVSPQPWLYFSPGHSFLRSEFPDVDAAVVRSLRRNNVEVVVLEKHCWLGNQDLLLSQMPQLRAWIQQNFTKATEFGIFEVWTSRTFNTTRAGTAAAALPN
jgi:hypothetical protein